MKLYNSETRQVEKFVPHNKELVTMYTCGPTVYDYAHIGNLRTYISEDVLEKTLKYIGYNVKRAMNITDVGHLTGDSDYGEDKMVKAAQKQNLNPLDIAKFYTEAFKSDCEKLNINWPEIVVPATSMIDEYIEMVSKLLSNGYAYIAGGNVYFDTSKLDNYYRFGNQNQDDLMVAVRDDVTEDKDKLNSNDFVLWFTKSKFENHALKWNSPWGEGYPGWHIECSAIALKNLGEYLDIHCGGVDNRFPHHTNEIAQTESYVGHKWCNYWLHTEFLNTKVGKMSKSTGGFSTLKGVIDGGYSPMHYRFFCLQSHYRRQLVFSLEGLEGAKSAYDKLIKRLENLKDEGKDVDNAQFENFDNQFKDALKNDLNTALAITTVFDVLKADMNDETKIAIIKSFDKVLSLGFTGIFNKEKSSVDEEFVKYIEEKIAERKLAKQNKDFAKADVIRSELLAKGVELIDTREGTKFQINK